MEPVKERKRLWWLGDSRQRLRGFPEDVRSEIGFALYQAEFGEPNPSTKPMQGINAVEIVADFDGDAFRGVYTTKIKENIYVLHCFRKKSTIGVKTPQRDIALIKKRLANAEKHHENQEREKERATEDKNRGGKR
jgi:phage-related protein